MAAYRARSVIPEELRRRPRWVRWAGQKIPQTVGGRMASSTDPATWTTYSDARRSAVGSGLGFVLNGDGIICFDLDGCIAPSGVVTPSALDLVRLAGDTYIEVSPSGRGLHIWGRATLLHGRRVSLRGQPVEVYPSGRYITVTGHRFEGSQSRLGDVSVVVAAVLP